MSVSLGPGEPPWLNFLASLSIPGVERAWVTGREDGLGTNGRSA